uniref:Uncharacterized protein n=1 Tax=Caenorhabditis japonica TaxID=281687 RepID=A0A8R1INN9_CAEJA
MDKPWEKYLKDLYTARYKMPEPREKFEESLWTPKALKECGKTGIRGALDYRMQSKEQQLKDDVSQVFTEEQLREVDRYEYTKYYLNPEEKVREELIRKRRARRRVVDDQAERLEQIDEESEDEGNEGGENMVAEEEEENEIEDVNEQQDGWGDDRYGNEYIEAIGPIGLQEWQLERVMSPVRTEEDLEESLRRVRRITIDQSSESLESSDGEILVKEPVKREKSLKERALEALSMVNICFNEPVD